jgi:7,8-dihydroneopterin aldolase/epimerase/oxygenase
MTDRIILHDMVFLGRHGVLEQEQREAQPFHVDVELNLDLQPAGMDDDLTRTVDYGVVFETCRSIVESTSFRLIEALAEAIALELLADFPILEVTVRVRKPNAPIEGTLAYAGVEIQRRPSARR